MIINCKSEEGFDLLSRELCTIPLGGLQIDIDPDLISQRTYEIFMELEKQA